MDTQEQGRAKESIYFHTSTIPASDCFQFQGFPTLMWFVYFVSVNWISLPPSKYLSSLPLSLFKTLSPWHLLRRYSMALVSTVWRTTSDENWKLLRWCYVVQTHLSLFSKYCKMLSEAMVVRCLMYFLKHGHRSICNSKSPKSLLKIWPRDT